MATTLRLYWTCIRNTLDATMCLQNFPYQEVQSHNKPEVELNTSPELLLNPVMADELENILTKKFLRILSMRAEAFQVLRRKPLQVMADELENILTKKSLRILSMRAEAFQVPRRKPLQILFYETYFLPKHFIVRHAGSIKPVYGEGNTVSQQDKSYYYRV